MGVIPMPFVYMGEGVMHAATPYFAKRADGEFKEGQRYFLVEHQERALNSHNHYFAQLADVWANLPDELAVQFPTVEILRAHALIMTGFRRERKFVASSPEEARKIAAFLRPQSASDDYAIISVHKNVVVEWKAKSQSYRAMGKRDFQDSKWKVLEFVSALIGVEPGTLQAEAGKAA